MRNKTNWDNEGLKVWNILYYKEDDKGNQKFYEFNGDCSYLCEGIDKKDLKEIKNKDLKQYLLNGVE
jgi:hypothetical protein